MDGKQMCEEILNTICYEENEKLKHGVVGLPFSLTLERRTQEDHKFKANLAAR